MIEGFQVYMGGGRSVRTSKTIIKALQHTRLGLASATAFFALSACATYVPPTPASPEQFSRDMNASYDRTWSAITYVAGASFFKIKAFEKASGLMTLDFDVKDVLPYVDCGTAQNSTTHQATPALGALGLAAVGLEGTANITIRSEGPKRTAVQFDSQVPTFVGLSSHRLRHPSRRLWSGTSTVVRPIPRTSVSRSPASPHTRSSAIS